MIYRNFICVLMLLSFSIFSAEAKDKYKNIDKVVENYGILLSYAESKGQNPRTINPDGSMLWCGKNFDWTEGFFPGSCWYIYEMTGDAKWKNAAMDFQALNRKHTGHSNHDLGFIFNCSYGNGYRLTGDKDMLNIMIEAGKTLVDRYNPVVKCIKSWNTKGGWQAKRGWKFPVIIDNMMNLELLFVLTEETGDSVYYNVAVSHANTTMKNHFRDNFSSFHVVDYDPETGAVRSRETAQGFSDESSWARGQAWALYGYTVCYRFTKDQKYLKQAESIADYIFKFEGMPDDLVPYWDYAVADKKDSPRDASAASITASALYELYVHTGNKKYRKYADKIMKSLSSSKYFADKNEVYGFLLKHSVGSIPHGAEIDVPLNYADYYYLEAMLRKNKL